MPPAFILSHDQTLKFMYDKIAVEFHDQAAHFKEPLCTKTNTCPTEAGQAFLFQLRMDT
jgi:hypothetical protein